MSTLTRKKLGESNPAATTLTALYTVPASTTTVISTINVCNRSATPTKFRIAHAVGGAADDPKQYLVYDDALDGNEVWQFTSGITLAAGDVLRIYVENATVSVNVYGEETGP